MAIALRMCERGRKSPSRRGRGASRRCCSSCRIRVGCRVGARSAIRTRPSTGDARVRGQEHAARPKSRSSTRRARSRSTAISGSSSSVICDRTCRLRRTPRCPLPTDGGGEIAQPLGVEVSFSAGEDVAPTEGNLRGVVHDENARAMCGVAGHAGLFGHARDVSRMVAYRSTRVSRRRSMARSRARASRVLARRCAGVDLGSRLGPSLRRRFFGRPSLAAHRFVGPSRVHRLLDLDRPAASSLGRVALEPRAPHARK